MKVCWVTPLLRRGRAFEKFLEQFCKDEKPEFKDHFPFMWPFEESKCMAVIEKINKNFDIAAGNFPPQIQEAIRKFYIQNLGKNIKFARWVAPAFHESTPEMRWCIIG